MTRYTATIAALLASTSLAHAGGIERNAFTTGILFETGNYVELGYSFVSPDVTGVQQENAAATSLAGTLSGDVTPSYGFTTLSYSTELSDRLTFALVYDTPIGADVSYATGAGYVFEGSEAELRSRQITAALRYEMTDNISVFGGLRAARVSGDAYVSTTAVFLIPRRRTKRRWLRLHGGGRV